MSSYVGNDDNNPRFSSTYRKIVKSDTEDRKFIYPESRWMTV